MVTALRRVLLFFDKIGVYDVVLPFLLVFTIVFAILEKTRILGKEDKKNLNAMVSFVIAFFVIASSKLVEILTTVSSHVVILLMLSILFLMLVGSFFQEKAEGAFLEGGWRIFFMFIMFIGIAMIFLNALGWLDAFWDFLGGSSGGEGIGAIVLIIIIILFMAYVVKEQKPEKKSSEKEKS